MNWHLIFKDRRVFVAFYNKKKKDVCTRPFRGWEEREGDEELVPKFDLFPGEQKIIKRKNNDIFIRRRKN